MYVFCREFRLGKPLAHQLRSVLPVNFRQLRELMQNYRLERTGLPPLEFTGDLIVEAAGSDPDVATEGRTTDVAIYAADDGQLLVSVRYNSPFLAECDAFVEAVNTADEAYELLCIYSPCDRIVTKRFDRNDPERLRTVERKLLRQYDQQVLYVMGQLRRYTESREPEHGQATA